VSHWSDYFDIEAYIDDVLGIRHTSVGAKGDEYVTECPYCGKDRKLYVNSESGFWVCYSCGEGGGLATLMMEVEGIDYRTAMAKLTKAAHERLSTSLDKIRARTQKRAERKQAKKKRAVAPSWADLPPEYVPIWDPHRRVWNRIGYLATRGIRLRTAQAFQLGFCLAGDYAGRLIFPVIDDGKIVSFTARATGDFEPKYRNPEAVSKGTLIYGIDQLRGLKKATIVEGPTDVTGMYQKKLPAGGLMGKLGTIMQAAKLREIGVEEVCLLLDGNAGEDVFKTAAIFGETLRVTIARLPGTLDPDDAAKKVVVKVLNDARPPTSRELRKARARL
jgi:DNA primase